MLFNGAVNCYDYIRSGYMNDIKYWRNDIKMDKKKYSKKTHFPVAFSHHYNHVHSTVSGRSWYDRPYFYLFAKNDNLFSFLSVCPSASPVQTSQPLIKYTVAFQIHTEVHSLGCTRQPKRPTVADYCVSMPRAVTHCFWLQENVFNSLLLSFSWMIARWWNNLRFTTSPLPLHMSPFNYHY
jgi:hypothetical protein